MSHPGADEILSWYQRLPDASHRRAIFHLLECEPCRQRTLAALAAAEALDGEHEVEPPPGYPPPPPPFSPDPPFPAFDFKSVFGRTVARAEDEQRHAEALRREVLAQPAARREVLVTNSRRFASLPLAEHLLDASRQVAPRDPGEAEALARLALVVLARTDSAFHGERLLADLSGRAWCHAAEARRRRGDLAGADECFRQAGELLEGSGDPAERAAFFHRFAFLRRDELRHLEAQDLLERAAGLYAESEDGERQGSVLADLGAMLLDRGHLDEALPVLLEALRLIDPLSDPLTAVRLRQSLAFAFADGGEMDQAAWMLAEVERLGAVDPCTALRTTWLAGRVAAGTDRPDEAEERFHAARRGFRDTGCLYEALQVAMDLALLYVRQQRRTDLKALADELAPLAFSPQLHPGAMTALIGFLQAAEHDLATAASAARVTRSLRELGRL
ncbi:MAG TPA: hypothetical protein VHQ65_17145, partial [Thermoanaerobaculia bacterium]|nr:hypothetical protein [Thermoanaerobaculia bacterium]